MEGQTILHSLEDIVDQTFPTLLFRNLMKSSSSSERMAVITTEDSWQTFLPLMLVVEEYCLKVTATSHPLLLVLILRINPFLPVLG